MKFPFISISAGARGYQLFIEPGNFIKALEVIISKIIRS